MFLFKPVSNRQLGSRLRERLSQRAFLALLFLTLPAVAVADEPIIAIGDVHGNYAALEGLLQQTKLINEKLEWSGKRTNLVFTGDLLDRGADSRKVLDLLMRLEGEATRKRGHVIVVLGNHEIMNMLGDLRYVSSEEYAAFADEGFAERRARAYEEYAGFIARKAEEFGQEPPVIDSSVRAAWEAAHPYGFFAHREAYGPNGTYGAWLRRRPVVAKVDDYLFLHGGISPALSSLSQKEINRRIWEEFETFDFLRKYMIEKDVILPFFNLQEMTWFARAELEHRKKLEEARKNGGDEAQHIKRIEMFLGYPEWFSFHPDGPVWFRGYSRWDEEEGLAKITPILKKHRVKHIVVGHSPHEFHQIRYRFSKSVILIDTGMLSTSFQGGRPSALEIRDGKWNAIYPEGKEPVVAPADLPAEGHGSSLPPVVSEEDINVASWSNPASRPGPIWHDPNGNRLPFESEEELLDFMKTAKVVWKRNINVGITNPWQLLLEQDGVQMRAAFRYVRMDKKPTIRGPNIPVNRNLRDHYIFEVVVYEFAKMLDLDVVPPAVERTRKVSGKRGSVQIWVENAMTERQRLRQKIRPPDQKKWSQQKRRLVVFDELIGNIDRNPGNIMIDQEWTIWLIDHTRAFQAGERLMNVNRIIGCERSLWEKIQALDEETVRRKFGKYLSKRELNDIMERRDAIVHHLKGLIAIQGEEEVIYSYPEEAAPTEDASVRP